MKGKVVKRYKSSWTIIITLPRDPQTGKYPRLVRNVRVETKREANEIMQDMLTELRTGTYVKPAKITLEEYLRTWLESRRPRLAPKTAEGYELYIRKHVIPYLGHRKLQDVKPIDIQNLYTELSKTLSQTTVERVHEMLHAALRRARKLRLIQYNPCEDVEAPRAAKEERRALKAEEIPALLKAAKDSPIRDFIVLALHTGARRGELLALRWEDVDFGAGIVWFRQGLTVVKGEQHIRAPKSGKKRPHVLTATALEVLMARCAANGSRGFVFARPDGQPLDPSTVTHQFKRVAKAAGFPDLTLHGLRHTHGSVLQAAGVGLKLIQERLGHETIAMTGDVYTHVDLEMQRRVAQKFEEIISHRFRTGSEDPGVMSPRSDPVIH